MLEYIITARAESAVCALNEARAVDPTVKLLKKLSFEEQLISAEDENFCKKLAETSMFIRHVFSVEFKFEKGATAAKIAENIAEKMDKTKRTALWYRPKYRESIAKELSEFANVELTGENPQQFVMLFTDKEGVTYAGISANAPYEYAGASVISRAELKLTEALDVFNIKLPKNGTALDLGAAPGGFTRILQQRGLSVTAVDPAEMDTRVLSLPNVTHLRVRAEEFAKSCVATFDLITSDMRMDAIKAAETMCEISRFLKEDGYLLTVLKLPEKAPVRKAKAALERLNKSFDIKKSRQLFNNQSEITVLAKLKGMV